MTVVALAAGSGSPGVTSTALGLALAAGRRSPHPPLLVEADPTGGSLALRFGLPFDPSIAEVSSVVARDVVDEVGVLRCAQNLFGLPCLVAPTDPLLAGWVLRRSAEALGQTFGALSRSVVIDLGRITADEPSVPLAGLADVTVVLTRSSAAEVQSALFTVRALRGAGANVAMAVIGDRPHHPGEVADLADAPLLAVLPDDRDMATALVGGAHRSRRLRRSRLWRSFDGLSRVLGLDRGRPTGPGPAPTAPDKPPARRTPIPPPGPRPRPTAEPMATIDSALVEVAR